MADIRIKDLPITIDVTTGDYVAIDSEDSGTRRFDLGSLQTSASDQTFLVTVTSAYDEGTGGLVLHADKSFAEITTAITEGHIPTVELGGSYYVLETMSENSVVFIQYNMQLESRIIIAQDDSVTIQNREVTSSEIVNESSVQASNVTGAFNVLSYSINSLSSGMTDVNNSISSLDSRVTVLESGGQSGGSGLTDDIKNALLQIANKVAYIDASGQNYYDNLYDALYNSTTRSVLLVLSHVSSTNSASTVEVGDSYTTILSPSVNYTMNTVTVTMGGVDITSTAYSSGTVSIPSVTGNIVITATAVLAAQSITATYTQSGTVYDTASLDSLKTDLVVTANYAGGTSETVPASDYTLSGTLTAGTSTITVSYAGLTTTFSVTVTHLSIEYLYNWDLTSSLVDSVSGQEITLVNSPTRDSSGLHFTAATQIAVLFGDSDDFDPIGKTIELDISEFNFKGSISNHARFVMMPSSNGTGVLIHRAGSGWSAYGYVSASSGVSRAWASTGYGDLYAGNNNNINAFNNKTVKIVLASENSFSLYLDGTLIGTISDIYLNNVSGRTKRLMLGGSTTSTSQSNGDQCYDMTVTGIRIYSNQT